MVDTEWELMRQRTMKGMMVQAEMPRALGKAILGDTPIPGVVNDEELHEQIEQIRALLNGFKPARADALKTVLAAQGLTVEALAARAFAATIVQLQHTERMATATSKRRNAVAAELERLQQRRQTASSKQPKPSRNLPHVDADGAPIAPEAGSAHEPIK